MEDNNVYFDHHRLMDGDDSSFNLSKHDLVLGGGETKRVCFCILHSFNCNLASIHRTSLMCLNKQTSYLLKSIVEWRLYLIEF